MHQPPATSLFLGLCLACLGAAGCGDDSSADDAPSSSTGEASTSPGTTVSVDSTGPGTGPAETTAAESTSTDPDTTAADTTGPGGDCQVWEITYDLEGSEMEISGTPLGAGDQVNTVTMPYDADENVGPGNFVLRFQDIDGAPGGQAAMYSYEMSIHFVIDSGVTVVATDLETDAGPEDCGVTNGMVEGAIVTWVPSAIVGHHSVGQVLCNGALCGAGGLPDGEPVPMDDTSDQAIDAFVFAPDMSSFTMAPTVVQMDANSTTAWMYTGTEASRELVDGPGCLCP